VEYLHSKSFSVGGYGEVYSANWERIFRRDAGADAGAESVTGEGDEGAGASPLDASAAPIGTEPAYAPLALDVAWTMIRFADRRAGGEMAGSELRALVARLPGVIDDAEWKQGCGIDDVDLASWIDIEWAMIRCTERAMGCPIPLGELRAMGARARELIDEVGQAREREASRPFGQERGARLP